ncbi:SDR family oxidoreductase [Fodinicola feengrottensis]|uniref:SDR family oxidoreductase n=1 Tax=Fodinicola feengrottensis TaxID=435914 RepID=A0ABN2HK28_9ACTN
MSIANDDSPVVLVTGGGSGIGRATALLLAREGWRVVVTGRQEDTLWEVADQNPNIRSITSDLAFADRATVSVDFAISAYGRLDALVNNAGMHVRMPTEETDFEAITEMLAINLIGPARLVTASIPHLAKTGGSIVNVSSALGQLPSLASGFYGASKAALDYLTRSWASELADRGIRVNAVAPGPTDSGLLERLAPAGQLADIKKREAALLPLGRLGDPAEVADWIHRLIDPAASWVTGQVFTIDGGMTVTSARKDSPS